LPEEEEEEEDGLAVPHGAGAARAFGSSGGACSFSTVDGGQGAFVRCERPQGYLRGLGQIVSALGE
jgi:hypothetical protein